MIARESGCPGRLHRPGQPNHKHEKQDEPMPVATQTPTTPTRRSAIGFSLAALAAGLTVPVLASASPTEGISSIDTLGTDAELIALVDRIMANGAESNRISDEIDRMPAARPADWQARDRRYKREIYPLTDANWQLRMELAMMRATTLEGFRAKARIVQEYNNCAPGFAESHQDDAMAWSLANDLLGVASVWRPEDDGEIVA
jgi:hypothetical protein